MISLGRSLQRRPSLAFWMILLAQPCWSVDQDLIVATVADRTLTQFEVQHQAKTQLRLLDKALRNGQYKAYWQTLEWMVDETRLNLAAKTQGQSPQAFIQQRMQTWLQPVTPVDVNLWVQQQGTKYDHLDWVELEKLAKKEIQTQRRHEFKSHIREMLRKEISANVYLEPPRVPLPTNDAPSKGPSSAPIEVVIFSDFECPFCGDLVPITHHLEDQYGDHIRLVFRQFPLQERHAMALKAAEASLCAGDQEAFWGMHDLLFEYQSDLSPPLLRAMAAQLGLDAVSFQACLDSNSKKAQVVADREAGELAGVASTPAVFVNGREVSFGAEIATQAAIEQLILDEMERQAAPPRPQNQGPTAIVAMVKDIPILKAQMERQAAPLLAELNQQFIKRRESIVEKAINQWIETQLLEMAAQARGQSVRDFYDSLVTAKVENPTSAEIAAYLKANQNALGQQNPEERIQHAQQYLREQHRQPLHLALLASLRHKYPVRLMPRSGF